MSRLLKGILATAPALAAVGLGAAPAAAQGGSQYDPLIGDLDGDGADDRVTLGGTPAEGCNALVELGDGQGGYGTPTSYAFEAPGSDYECPDMGVIVDLGGDGVSELVLAWFYGSSLPDTDLLVLRDFVPVDGFEAIWQPSRIGTAHIDGDGLVDVWEYTDQGAGFRTYLNTPDSQLVPGPLVSCEDNASNGYQLHDLDGDGDVELVQHFDDGCHTDPWAAGVAVVHGDGTRQVLVASRDIANWDIQVSDTDADGDLDIVTTADTGVVYTYLNNGDGTFASPK